jgi:hypothetical protein
MNSRPWRAKGVGIVIHPPMLRGRCRSHGTAVVQARLWLGLHVGGRHDSRDEHVVAGHDRRAPADTRYFRRPDDVLGGIPRRRKLGIISRHTRVRPAELRPVTGHSHHRHTTCRSRIATTSMGAGTRLSCLKSVRPRARSGGLLRRRSRNEWPLLRHTSPLPPASRPESAPSPPWR